MTDYKALCAEVFAYHEGQDKYDFSHLNPYDRENAAFDAWQEIKAELKHALAQPEPEGPSDEELDLVVIAIQALIPPQPDATTHHLSAVDRGREILRQRLARWGRPTPPVVMPVLSKDTQVIEPPETTLLVPYFSRPVPVRERLPGPEDCDAEGRCWWYGEGGDMVGWTLNAEGPSYYRAKYWLPAHALPVPPQ
jgi:hypothetical protein